MKKSILILILIMATMMVAAYANGNVAQASNSPTNELVFVSGNIDGITYKCNATYEEREYNFYRISDWVKSTFNYTDYWSHLVEIHIENDCETDIMFTRLRPKDIPYSKLDKEKPYWFNVTFNITVDNECYITFTHFATGELGHQNRKNSYNMFRNLTEEIIAELPKEFKW